VVNPGDIKELAEAIEKLCATDGSTPFSERTPGAVARYERSCLTKDLASLLDKVTRKQAYDDRIINH
jgi:hypothetical protein